MRSLCVAEAYPWPSDDGYKLRLSNTIEALRLLGDVDFLCMDGSGRERDPAPSGVRVLSAPEDPELTPGRWAPRWIAASEPRRLVRRDFSTARRLAPGLLSAPYDVTLFSHVDAWHATHDLVDGPAVLDFDNLEDLALRGLRRLGPRVDVGASLQAKAIGYGRWAVTSVVNRIDEGRWNAVQHRAAAAVDRVLVCSEMDIARSGCSNVSVMANGYELPWEPVDHDDPHDADKPTFTFVGVMGYPPNVDAVRWFADRVLPLVHRTGPGARFRIVGRSAEAVADLDLFDGVSVVGAVDSMRDELAAADVAVVPIRSGAGTRLKVLEAMANGLPMVSTTVGCEGIDVADRQQLLIADGPEAFAAACLEAATDVALRRRMIQAGRARFEERYTWSAIRESTAEIVRSAISEHR